MARPDLSTVFPPASEPRPPSASMVEVSDRDRFLSSFLNNTRSMIGFSSAQIPSLSPSDLDGLSARESVLIPLLYSAMHAISSIGTVVEELRTKIHDLQSLVANSPLVEPSPDDQLAGIQSALHDLSHWVSVPPPPPSLSTLAPPLLRPQPGRGAPPPPPPRPTNIPAPSFAQVVGGESNLDRAARERFGPGGIDLTNRRKKNPSKNSTSANKVMATVTESSVMKVLPPLSNAVRHFFAPRASPSPYPDTLDIRTR